MILDDQDETTDTGARIRMESFRRWSADRGVEAFPIDRGLGIVAWPRDASIVPRATTGGGAEACFAADADGPAAATCPVSAKQATSAKLAVTIVSRSDFSTRQGYGTDGGTISGDRLNSSTT
jgi:hypothetical protein